jgi:hypothetical protein
MGSKAFPPASSRSNLQDQPKPFCHNRGMSSRDTLSIRRRLAMPINPLVQAMRQRISYWVTKSPSSSKCGFFLMILRERRRPHPGHLEYLAYSRSPMKVKPNMIKRMMAANIWSIAIASSLASFPQQRIDQAFRPNQNSLITIAACRLPSVDGGSGHLAANT